MDHMYIMSIFFFFFFFERKSYYFIWVIKYFLWLFIGVWRLWTWQKKTYDQKVTLTEEPKSLVSWSCSRLFSVFPKLKILKFPKIKAICKKTHYKKMIVEIIKKIMKKIVQCIMYEKNWNWWTSPCVSEQRSSAASLTLKLKKVWNRWLTTQQLERVYCVFCGRDQWNSGQLCMLGLTRWKLMSAIMSGLKDFWNLDYDNMTFENCILFM